MRRRAIRFLLIGAAILAAIQFVPEPKTNPPATREVRWNSPQTRALAQRACFDCHSNLTVWPWYSHVAPISMLVVHHVTDGRARLNFSEWDRPNAGTASVTRAITDADMPIGNYVLMHPDAQLTSAERQQLIAGLQATFAADPPIARPGRGR